jgi:hypothetical protein
MASGGFNIYNCIHRIANIEILNKLAKLLFGKWDSFRQHSFKSIDGIDRLIIKKPSG